MAFGGGGDLVPSIPLRGLKLKSGDVSVELCLPCTLRPGA